jgi:hypothetical protein
LEALNTVSDIERGALRQLFRARLDNRHRKPDWRDLDAAALEMTSRRNCPVRAWACPAMSEQHESPKSLTTGSP